MKKKLKLLLATLAGIFVVTLVAFLGCIIWVESDTFMEELGLSDSEENASASPAARIADVDGQPLEEKYYTLLVYLNGSDLESNGSGCASDDLEEMMAALHTNSDNVNVVVLAGGTLDWRRKEIGDKAYQIFYLENDKMTLLYDLGEQDIGDPALLSEFLNLGLTYFPAEHTALILWNHGGGSIYGYGNDEMTGHGLRLMKISEALENGLKEKEKLDFIGFDACLMGNLETACSLSPYADYLIASEEIEPSTGWDYSFIEELCNKNADDTEALGRKIVDLYVEGLDTKLDYFLDTQATLSVTDLSRLDYLTTAMDTFASEMDTELLQGGYTDIAKARYNAKSFGDSSEASACYDMVDILSVAAELEESAPQQYKALSEAVDEAVVYSAHNANVGDVCGLSVYFPFKSKDDVEDALDYYGRMNIMPEYTKFIGQFSKELLGTEYDFSSFKSETPQTDQDGNYTIQLSEDELNNLCNVYFTLWEREEEVEKGIYYYVELAETSDLTISEDGTVTTEFDGAWTTLNDYWVCMYEIDRTENQIRYGIPAYVNDQDVDIIVVYDRQNPDGKVAGARLSNDSGSNMASKQMIEIKPGDEITLFYWAELFYDDEVLTDMSRTEEYEDGCWYTGDTWTVPEEGLILERSELDKKDYLYSFALYDTSNDVHYTDFSEVE